MEMNEVQIIHRSTFYNHLTDGVVITTQLFLMVHPKGADVCLKQFNSLTPDHCMAMIFDCDQIDLLVESLSEIANTINNVN